MRLQFDHIVIGAGSAGCVIAARLSEDAGRKVLLLEAGGSDWNPMVRIPLGVGSMIRSGLHGWGIVAEPSPGLNGRRLPFPRGKVLGGTSSINGMIYIRGNAADYDELAALGNRNWAYRDVLPYFLRSECHATRRDPFHGTQGPLRVRVGSFSSPIYSAFLEAGLAEGDPVNHDFNGPTQLGFGRYDFTIDRGRRQSAAVAFLKPARRRGNLTLVTRAMVHRVLIEGGRARGVLFRHRGKDVIAHSDAVTVCAGAVHSPHLLMLSGIGDPRSLRSVGATVVHDLPGVGRNLRDHARTQLHVRCPLPLTLHAMTRVDRIAVAAVQAAALRSGPAACFPAEVGGFTAVEDSDTLPEAQWFCYLGTSHNRVRWPALFQRGTSDQELFGVSTVLLRCESAGEIRLKSTDPRDNPLVCPNLLDSERDVDRLVTITQRAQDLLHRKAFSRLNAGIVSGTAELKTPEQWRNWVRQTTVTSSHPVGTCKMGSDPLSVVDDQLRVHGLEGLRVADASILPFTPRGNTNAPTIMIAEKAADLIRRSQ